MSTINFMVAFEKYYSDDVKREVTLLMDCAEACFLPLSIPSLAKQKEKIVSSSMWKQRTSIQHYKT